MSLESWKKEFYPIDADDPSLDDDRKLLEHSIKKWNGLLNENMEKHGVFCYNEDTVVVEFFDEDGFIKHSFDIDESTCSLCAKYLVGEIFSCVDCPLKEYLGQRCDFGVGSPYVIWCDTNDPMPMIEALQEALKYCLQ